MIFSRKSVEKKNNRSYRKGAVLALALAVAGAGTAFAASQINILETGSSLLYPLFNLWVPAFTKAHPNIKITTQSTGSGTGISQSVEGIAQIGASDAYLSDAMERMHSNMLNIPLAISSQMINYNIPGLNYKHLNLSGPVLAGIYMGKITNWDDAQIAKINPGVKLPNHRIIPIHRTDGSGDTFIFTQYLSFSTPEWANSLSYGTTVSWPAVSGGLGAEGNPGMVTALVGSPYSIAYIGVSYKAAILQHHMGTAALANRAGKYVMLTPQTVSAAAAQMVPKTPQDERVSLVFAPGADSYPIINYEYAIVNKSQPSADTAAALRTLFTWAISGNGGNSPKYMNEVNFAPLPPSVVKLSQAQINQIQ
jgi:phosphate transport system substrate-binding protein